MTSAVAYRFEAEGATDVGKVRKNNEDWWAKGVVKNAERAVHHLWIVADGMGGGAKGEVASQLAVETLVNHLAASTWRDEATALRDGFQRANSAVFERGTGGGEAPRSIMGTTLVAALLAEDTGKLWIANSGDSRAYLLGANGLVQISEDHSLVAERVRQGDLTPEEARTADERNIVTRAVGLEEHSVADVFEVGILARGERVLLCSDGVHGMIDDAQMAPALGAGTIAAAAKRLVDEAWVPVDATTPPHWLQVTPETWHPDGTRQLLSVIGSSTFPAPVRASRERLDHGWRIRRIVVGRNSGRFRVGPRPLGSFFGSAPTATPTPTPVSSSTLATTAGLGTSPGPLTPAATASAGPTATPTPQPTPTASASGCPAGGRVAVSSAGPPAGYETVSDILAACNMAYDLNLDLGLFCTQLTKLNAGAFTTPAGCDHMAGTTHELRLPNQSWFDAPS